MSNWNGNNLARYQIINLPFDKRNQCAQVICGRVCKEYAPFMLQLWDDEELIEAFLLCEDHRDRFLKMVLEGRMQ